MVTIAASRVWALNTQRRLLWTSHAPIAGGWPSRGCGPGFVSCKGAGYPCLCRDLGFPLVATGGRLLPAVAGLVLQWQWGIPLKQRGLLLLLALRYRWSCLGNGLAPPMEGGYRLYPLALPPTIGCRSLHWRVSQTNPEMMVQYRCHPPGGQRCRIRIRKWWLCLPGPLRVLGSSGGLHRVPNPQGWTIGFLGWPALVLRAPPRCLSSRKCMMSSLEHGRHLSLPETAPVAHPPSPPLTAERRGGILRSRRWSDRLRCNCVQGPLLPGAVIRCSPPGPVGTRRPWPAVPMRPAEKLLQPYTLWRCCRFTRPRHWGTCTRVVTTQEFSVSFGPPRTSRYERRRLRRGLWAVRCPPWWSRNATSGCVWLTWRRQTRHGSWMPPCPRPACSATRWRTSPSSSPLHRSRLRQSGTSCPGVQLLPPPGRRRQCLGLLVAEGGPLPPPPLPRSRHSSLQPSSAVEPAAGQPPRPSRPPPNQAASVGASGPETDDPGMEMFALREMVNAPLPPPEEGRAENLLFPFLPLASRSVVPKTSAKEQFPLSLGPQRGRGVVNESNLSYTHPPLSPVGSCGRFERAVNRTTHAPSARTQVSASHTPTPLRTGNETLEPGPCVPPRCPTAGTSVGSLVSLVRFWGAWLALPNPSRWLLRTIRLGYAIQFARRPPKYRGIHSTTVRAADAPILRAEIAVLLAKDAIEPVPPADMRSGFYSPYFIVPKKSGGLRPILDLRVLNRALHRLPFKMLTPKRIFGCVRPQDWFAAIDLKDAYFHVSILPRHRPFLRFAFEGRAYQYKVLPFGLSLSPRVFTKVAEAALVPLREQGVRILNYLDDWLILAQSQDQLCEHRDMVLSHLSQLGLQVNWEKSKLSPVQRISFLGMELDSVSQTARLTQERAQSVLNCLNTFKNRTAAPLKQFQRLLGHMAAAAAVTPVNLFVEWCSSHREDPRRCPIRVVLSFLQQGLERRLSPSTLKVYMAAIAANHDPVEGKSVGKHDWVVRFLRGARRLNPPRPPSIPSWDLSLVLRALQQGPFEPLQTVEPKFLSMKTLLLLALASIKRVGDLHPFSVDDSCLQFGPADSQIILRPRPGYVPKVPTTPFRDQVVSLQALPPEEADPALALLCPVRALRHYVDRTQSFRTSDQLFVCHGGRQKGKAVSKQRMAHWIVDAITLAYQAQGVPCPFRLRAHSTRSVASSWALARGASLTDICRAAGWATPNTFARFYSLRVEPVSSCVLTSNG